MGPVWIAGSCDCGGFFYAQALGAFASWLRVIGGGWVVQITALLALVVVVGWRDAESKQSLSPYQRASVPV
jgi:hypothetical protein